MTVMNVSLMMYSGDQGGTARRKPGGFCEMADFAHDAAVGRSWAPHLKSALCRFSKGAKPPSKNRALVGSPLKSSAVTVHLAGSGMSGSVTCMCIHGKDIV